MTIYDVLRALVNGSRELLADPAWLQDALSAIAAHEAAHPAPAPLPEPPEPPGGLL